MTTYEEIVKALKAILECAKENGYLDDYSFLNAKWDTIEKSPLQEEQEKALMEAIVSLQHTIEDADTTIHEKLDKLLQEIAYAHMVRIPTKYKDGEELRKLAAQDMFIQKLQEISLPSDILMKVPETEDTSSFDEEFSTLFEEIVDDSVDFGDDSLDAFVEIDGPDEETQEEQQEEPVKELEETAEEETTVVEESDSEEPVLEEETLPEEVEEPKEEISLHEMEKLLDIPAMEQVVVETPKEEPVEEPESEEKEMEEEESSSEEESSEEPMIPADGVYPSDIDWTDTSHAFAVNEEQYLKLQQLNTEEEKAMFRLPSKESEEVSEEPVEEPKETSEEEAKVEESEETPKEEPKAEEPSKEEPTDVKAHLNKIQLLKKALDKAKAVHNEQLIKILESQLAKEVVALKGKK